MAFDEAKFRAEAKAAGYSDDDIDAELKVAVPPPSPAAESANKATAENDAAFANQTEEMKKKFDESVKQTTTFPVQVGDFKANVPAVFGTPAGLGLIAAGLYGGYKATEATVKTGKKVYDSLRDKMSSGAQTAPTFAQELATDQNIINQTKSATTNAPTPINPTVDLNTPVGNVPKDMEIVKQSEQNKLKNELAKQKTIGVNPFEGATELRTGTGKAAYEGMNLEGKMRSTYPSIRDVPQGKAFIPNAQYIDVLRNDLGQPTYTQSFTNRDFPTEYKGSIETGKEINRGLGRETRAQLEARGVPREQMPEPTKGILERVGGPKGSKVIKVGGVAGALISLADLAKAENLRQGIGNVAEGLLPMGITPSELASGTLTEKQLKAFQEAQKLGSPYRSVPPPR